MGRAVLCCAAWREAGVQQYKQYADHTAAAAAASLYGSPERMQL